MPRRVSQKLAAFVVKMSLLLMIGYLVFVPQSAASAHEVDFSKAIIVAPRKTGRLERKAITVLQEEVKKRTGITLRTSNTWPKKSLPVIVVGQYAKIKKIAGPYADLFTAENMPGAEGFRLVVKSNPSPTVFIVGSDARGVLYGVGKLLRQARLKDGSIIIPGNLDITTAPRYAIRGHQLGYRPKTNAYDAWSVEQFDQYIRELAIFGANSIEIMPPRTDDDRASKLMKMAPMDMMIKQAEIIDSYGMDVWIWYPNMGSNYTNPDSIRKELQERDIIFKRLKRIDAVFVPGGDPGDLHPNILFDWLKKVAVVLHKYHPNARIWVSPQAFRPTKDWLDAFYRNVNKHYSWFGGVVFGPWIKTPLPEIRKIVDPDIPIRRYPDITHSISCQYPVRDWDLAFAMTLGRECYNPRPVAEKKIHNALDQFANGSLSYSEGINDDVNKFIWSSQDWNPDTPAIETLREYSRFFIHPDYAEDVAQGIMALERNWEGSLLTNPSVMVTLHQWQQMEKVFPHGVTGKYRFQMGLLRAYYDAYIQERLVHETALERKAREILRQAKTLGSERALDEAKSILLQKETQPVAQDLKKRCWKIADYLFNTIGSQTSRPKHGAQDGRGNFMDYIDVPLNDAVWLLSEFKNILKLPDETSRLGAIEEMLTRTNPGPGGWYDNLGTSTQIPRLAQYPSWEEDPGGLLSPRVSFGVGLRGEEWVHTVQAKGFDGRPTPLAWMHQLTTLYQIPLTLFYDDLDPHSNYVLKVAYTGRFRAKIQLIADDKFQIHAFMRTGRVPIHEFQIPAEATRDGRLKLTWISDEGERGAQVAEVWLMRAKK